jgi:1-deoxy-D-xylulose 5-phosphate reductoisomerase
VAAFLEGRLRFPEISRVVARTMEAHEACDLTDLGQVLAVNRWARDFAAGLISPKVDD